MNICSLEMLMEINNKDLVVEPYYGNLKEKPHNTQMDSHEFETV